MKIEEKDEKLDSEMVIKFEKIRDLEITAPNLKKTLLYFTSTISQDFT